ncbi:MAG TPA: mechanosensitive ion channel family protein [Gemmatimonadota bacterium]|nr:mechanosensitive ion channel family protein [Gemmatimonadota bacterium]
MIQDEPLPIPAPEPSSSDTTAVMEGLERTVDRISEVRSIADLWALAGDFQVEVLRFAGRLIVAALVILVFAGIYWVMARALRPIFERSRLQEDAAQLLTVILRYVVLGFAVVLALGQLGFNITGLLAGLGVAGLALGFAAKDTLANFIAGMTILWDRPFRVGDRVEIDGEFGQVKRITLRSTRIHTNQNIVVIIPNQNVVNNKIINHTMQASTRVDVAFGIAYKEDIDKARRTVLALTEGDERLRARPGPDVVVTGMAESSVNLALRFWLSNPHIEVPVELEYIERIKKALDGAGIEIPFPHRSLLIERLPEPGSPATGPTGSAAETGDPGPPPGEGKA